MLTLSDKHLDRNCQGRSRRDFLKIGALALGGLTLPNFLNAKARAAEAGISPIRDKAVVLLFLHGGPPHIETFDPKMSAPVDIRSITGEVKTCLPGVSFGATFPKMAARADRLAVVRSYGSNNAGHTYLETVSAGNPMKAAASSVYAKLAGTNNPRTGMPTNCLVLPESINPKLKLETNFETGTLPGLTRPGTLGPAYGAFNTAGGGNLHADMQLRLSPDRLSDRLGLLRDLDNLRRRVDHGGTMEAADRYQQQAFDVITRGAAEAFDLSKEDPRTIEKYDTSKLFDISQLHRWNDMRRASNLLGKQMLMARRLVEAGCGFVSVSDCGWDYHANGNSPKRMAGIYPMGGQVDHAVAAFMDDLADRGLTDKVLLVITSEMGRTPKLNNGGGRDHYGKLTPLVFAGGGLKMGQVVGESNRTADEAITTPYGPGNLLATIMHTLVDPGQVRLMTGVPKDVANLVTDGRPIRELI